MPSDTNVDAMIATASTLGPFRKHPTGELYAYAQPEEAEYGDPVGIYVPAEEVLRRHIATVHDKNWTPARRTAVLDYLKDQSYTTLSGEINQLLIPTLSGVLDMTPPLPDDGPARLPHSPHFGFTAQVPHPYLPDAECPKIERFLRVSLPEDAIPVFWEMLGYTLLPVQFLRRAVMLVGPSGTGKSTLLYLVEQIVGRPNCSHVPLQSFAEDKFSSSNLFGKLANIGGDLDATEVASTGVFKSLTGDDMIRADVKYGKPITFRSYATHWYAANEVPPSRDHSDAWRERWITLPMEHKPSLPDPTLRHALSDPRELQGALRLAIDHLSGLLSRGKLTASLSVDQAGENLHRRTDHVQGFIQLLRENGGFHPRSATWAQYKLWAQDEGVRYTVRKSTLYDRLQEAFGPPAKTQGEFGWNIH